MPPGAPGGTIDGNLLTVGATLGLPVQVEGSPACVGDPHVARGDGEVSQTAMGQNCVRAAIVLLAARSGMDLAEVRR